MAGYYQGLIADTHVVMGAGWAARAGASFRHKVVKERLLLTCTTVTVGVSPSVHCCVLETEVE